MTQPAPAPAESFWQLTQQTAQLGLDGLGGTLDLSAPRQGLFKLSVFGRGLAGHILGVQSASQNTAPREQAAEYYERGTDLVAAYEQSDQRPYRVLAYWRVVRGNLPPSGMGLDLIVSVQTNLLDVTPELRTSSRLTGVDVAAYPIVAGSAEQFRLDPRSVSPHAGDAPAQEIGCVAMRMHQTDATYCEMIHPSDSRGLEMTSGDGQTQWGWRLVGHFMEKGVIRRLRLRGIFLPGRIDDRRVVDLYTRFAALPPPLTT